MICSDRNSCQRWDINEVIESRSVMLGENFQFRRPHVMLLLRLVHPFSTLSLKIATYRGVGLAGSDPVRLRGKRGEKSLLLFRYA